MMVHLATGELLGFWLKTCQVSILFVPAVCRVLTHHTEISAVFVCRVAQIVDVLTDNDTNKTLGDDKAVCNKLKTRSQEM